MTRDDQLPKKKKQSKCDKYGSVSKIEGKKFNESKKPTEQKKGPKTPLDSLKDLPTPLDLMSKGFEREKSTHRGDDLKEELSIIEEFENSIGGEGKVHADVLKTPVGDLNLENVFQLRGIFKTKKHSAEFRIQMPSDVTFKKLHTQLLKITKWPDTICHAFTFESQFKFLRVGVKAEGFDTDFDETTTQLRAILRGVNDSIAYRYEMAPPIMLTHEAILNKERNKKYPILMDLTGKFPREEELFEM
jgi:hypothetical protein